MPGKSDVAALVATGRQHMIRRSTPTILALGLFAAFSGSALAAESSADALVVGQELTGIDTPFPEGVFWTRRADHYTLQIRLGPAPARSNLNPPAAQSAAAPSGNPYPDMRVQLRDKNGALLPHMRRLAVSPNLQAQPVVRGGVDNARRSEVIYTFALSVGDSAETITLLVNGTQYVTRIPRL
jgi:hypothetical protein